MTFRGFWKFLILERMGLRRPLPTTKTPDAVGPEDLRLRHEFEERLRRALEQLDITAELWALRERKR